MELLTQHDRALSVYVYSLVSASADADDILQQTKMILWRCFDQFESGTNFIAWARKTAFHQVLTHLPWFLLVDTTPSEGPRAVMMGLGWAINTVVAELAIRAQRTTRVGARP